MEVKKTLFLAVLILAFSCKGQNDRATFDKLFIKIDSIFANYTKEHYIEDSILDYYKHENIDCSNLDIILKQVHLDDQDVRHIGDRDMYIVDSINRVKVTSILRNCKKELQESKLSRNAYLGLFLTIQHSDDIDLMAYFYNDMKNMVSSNKLGKASFAVFIDRFLVKTGEKQVFSTQYNSSAELYEIENLEELNKRRKYMNLLPLD